MWENLNNLVPIIALGIYLPLIVIEIILDLKNKSGGYSLKDTLCSMSTAGFYLGTKFLMKGATLFLLYLAWEYRFFETALAWPALIGAYFATDFLFYWLHRMIHEVRVGWAAHIVHHSSERFNLGGTALRQSFAEPFMEAFFYAPAVLIGFHPLAVLIAIELNLIYMFWVHTERISKLPAWFEAIFSTPSHHRVHHARNIPYLDKNYGGTFIFWDRMFGTFALEKEKPEFGIPEPVGSFNPLWVSLHGWFDLLKDVWQAKGLINKVAYCVMPPGWAPDGKGQTTRQIQQQYREDMHQADADTSSRS